MQLCLRVTLAVTLAAALMSSAAARDDELIIQITPAGEAATPIAVVPFLWSAAGVPGETDMSKVISDDLARSGQFNPLPLRDMVERPSRLPDVNYGLWRRLEVNYLVIGEITGSPLDGYEIRMHLLDVVSGEALTSLVFGARAGGLRYTAHHIADTIYEELLEVPGFFRTRIAYITAEGEGDNTSYSLMVADADGFNPQPIVRSREPLLSPAWSPDASRLAYVSFEQGNSSIFIQELATGQREQVARFRGINGAPSFSPDGRRLALTLSRTGNPEIYVMDLSSRRLRQITNHWAIDTEPVWAPDGQTLVFTSDRGGKPQLYQVSVSGDGKPQRVTRQGDYNARASMSPSGDRVALVSGTAEDYRIALMDRETYLMQIVSDGPLDESPSFAPNGRMVLYASRRGQQGVLSAVPVYGAAAAGHTAHQLIYSDGHIREPAWSPLRQ
ncbi:MAG: Tol-Pal system beta propeller repeat protein TolB [Xanthomonadales bacterium]|nr:Tol-Pal system beta propeller repeat protein TolB [Xanthomonadales bacterium]